MLIFRWLFSFLVKLLFFCFCFVLAYGIIGVILPKIKVNKDFVEPAKGVDIFILSNGVHADIVVPVKTLQVNWSGFFPISSFEDVDSSSPYISFGWGDKGFFLETPTWGDLKFSTAFKAVFFMGESAMHVSYKEKAPILSPDCKKITISEVQYKKLTEYILSSFELENQVPVLIQNPGYDEADNFYEAEGKYSFIHTCNTWTNKALKHSGVKTGIWSPFDFGILEQFE